LSLHCHAPSLDLPSFPTRRSSDLAADDLVVALHVGQEALQALVVAGAASGVDVEGCREQRVEGIHADAALETRPGQLAELALHGDRKSTRLNSSHVKISYAVFCLK